MDPAIETASRKPVVTTNVISVTRPVIRVTFGPDGRIALSANAWLREYDGRTRQTRLIATNVGDGRISYAPDSRELLVETIDDVPATPAVTDGEAGSRLAAAGYPFVAVQRNTVRRGTDGLTYVAWTHSVTTILTGAVLHGPVLVTPERIVPLSKSATSVRVLMDGDDVYLVERALETYARVTVTKVGEASGFAVPHDQDLSSWTSVVRTPLHAIVSSFRGYIADLRRPEIVMKSAWHVEGEPHRVAGGAVVNASNGTNRAHIWLHENGIDSIPAQSPLTSLVRTGPNELAGWHMRGQSELVVRTYALPRD